MEAIYLASHSLAILQLNNESVYTLARIEKLVCQKCQGSRLDFNKARRDSVKDIFTMDVTKLAFRRSMVAY